MATNFTPQTTSAFLSTLGNKIKPLKDMKALVKKNAETQKLLDQSMKNLNASQRKLDKVDEAINSMVCFFFGFFLKKNLSRYVFFIRSSIFLISLPPFKVV